MATLNKHWYVIDAEDQILGRLSTKIARVLTGKDKPAYVPYQDCGDYVVVINAEKIKTTGKKETDKIYYRHSMYRGGLKAESLRDLRNRKPTDVVAKAVRGMVPRGRLGNAVMKKLYIYAGNEHPHKNAQVL